MVFPLNSNKIITFGLLLVSIVLLYFNWIFWHSFLIGFLGLAIYYIINTIGWSVLVEKIFSFSRAWNLLFGFFLSFYLSIMVAGIPIVIWKYDRMLIAFCLLFVGLLGLFIKYYLLKNQMSSAPLWRSLAVTTITIIFKRLLRLFGARNNSLSRANFINLEENKFNFKNKYFWFLGILSALFIFLIFHARTAAYILSPWDAISSFALILFFGIVFLVCLLIFSKKSSTIILTIIIAFSFLTHLYLPVVYEAGFGGDKWRHLASERWLQEGKIYEPSIWGSKERSVVSFGGLNLPEALVAGNKTSYASQWAATIFLAESLGIDIFWVDLLLVFLLWSLFLPLILYRFGRVIADTRTKQSNPQLQQEISSGSTGRQVLATSPYNDKLPLLLAFLPTLFYTFQSEGAITIPVSFGHLFFFFIFLIWVYYLKNGQKLPLLAASVFSLFFYWGYILNFLVLLGVGILAFLYRRLFIEKSHWQKLKAKFGFSDKRLLARDMTFFSLAVFGAIFAIPFLEVFQGLSQFSGQFASSRGIVDALANAFGQLSGFIGSIVPPDFIDQGNFLYNQTAMSLSRLPLFSYQVVPFIVSSFVWAIIVWGIYRLWRYNRANNVLIFLSLIFIISLFAYFISWSYTSGVHILARRLNETIVFLMIIFLGWGIWQFLAEQRIKIIIYKKILAISFVLAFASTSTYASGPKLQLVTGDELAASKIIWQDLKNQSNYCVIGNTWPLLGLEAVSGREIIGGGFPVYTEYAQPERVKIFEGLSKKYDPSLIEVAFRITEASICYYMTERPWVNEAALLETINALGEPRQAGKVFIWKIKP